MSVLTINGVQKHFGGNPVLNGIDMELQRGKIYQMIGPNGCGKTTLINVISGMLRPDGGSIIYEGKDITKKGLYETYKMGIVRTWQIPQPFITLTTFENLLFSSDENSGESFVYAPTRMWHKDEEKIIKRATEVMKIVGLSEKKDTISQNLSGGQQKLLELGRAIMSGAKLILMDEPIAGVNPTLAKEIFQKISDISEKQNITFLIVEHRLDISFQYVEHVFAMDEGKIIVQGTPQQIVKDPIVIETYLGE